MTGFGRGKAELNGREIQIEMKSVNHRYLDISLRMPRTFNVFEDIIRKTIATYLSRGHVDVFVTYTNTGDASKEVQVDLNVLSAYMDAFIKIEESFDSLRNDVTLMNVSRLPDVMSVVDSQDDEQAIGELLIQALNQALTGLKGMRVLEGKSLIDDAKDRLRLIEANIKDIETMSDTVVEEYKEKLNDRITMLLDGVALDENRLQAEVAVFADRCNVTEEIVRLKSHIDQFVEALETDNAIGRKLDFIVQEMNREANTIGSKANNLKITNAVVEIKGEIEKIREQVQNIE